MKAADVQLGLLVRRQDNESSFCQPGRGAAGKIRRVGVVVSGVERYGPKHSGVKVQWIGSTLTEVVMLHRLTVLPKKEQPVALGGKREMHGLMAA